MPNSHRGTAFIDRVTTVDHALVTQHGYLQGGSYALAIEIVGRLDAEFGVLKAPVHLVRESAKRLISNPIDGFDNKVWLVDSYSDADLTDLEGKYQIYTPKFECTVPAVSFKYVEGYDFDDYDCVRCIMEEAIEVYLNDKLKMLYPAIDQIKVNLVPAFGHFTEDGDVSTVKYLRYTHSLVNPYCDEHPPITGHHSYLRVVFGENHDKFSAPAFDTIRNEIMNTFYVNKSHVKEEGESWHISCGHSTTLIIPKTGGQKYEFVDFEPTSQNLVNHVVSKYKDSWRIFGISSLEFSAGLEEGAKVYL